MQADLPPRLGWCGCDGTDILVNLPPANGLQGVIATFGPAAKESFHVLLPGRADCTGSAWKQISSSRSFRRSIWAFANCQACVEGLRYNASSHFHQVVPCFHRLFNRRRNPNVEWCRIVDDLSAIFSKSDRFRRRCFCRDKPSRSVCRTSGNTIWKPRTISSRLAKSFKALPTISSLDPAEYQFAVSKKLIRSPKAFDDFAAFRFHRSTIFRDRVPVARSMQPRQSFRVFPYRCSLISHIPCSASKGCFYYTPIVTVGVNSKQSVFCSCFAGCIAGYLLCLSDDGKCDKQRANIIIIVGMHWNIRQVENMHRIVG